MYNLGNVKYGIIIFSTVKKFLYNTIYNVSYIDF